VELQESTRITRLAPSQPRSRSPSNKNQITASTGFPGNREAFFILS
jgi:hypothetical protein